MRAILRQLELCCQGRGLEFELEQLSGEFEQQCGPPLRLKYLKLSTFGTVELQGWCFLQHAKSTKCAFLVGRKRFEDQAHLNLEHFFLKRIGNLFNPTFSYESLYQAYLDARKGKRKKQACFEFEVALGGNIESLHKEIHEGTYKPQPYKQFTVYEPKERIIHAPSFRDIVVQHAIYRAVYPIFDKTFIDQSFACRKGMGTHKCSQQTQKYMRACGDDEYTLKLDIRKFFYSIDRAILRELIEKEIKDRRFVDIMMKFADMDTPVGIPIGNLLSQIYALIFMNPVDHFVKRSLKVKKYVRYVDDFILIGIARDQCLEYRAKIIDFIGNKLKLKLSKSTIQKVKKGINFVGYRTWKSKRFIRKYSLYKFRKMVKQNNQAAAISILGHAKHTASLPYMFKILGEIKNDIKIPKNFQGVRRQALHHYYSGGAGL